jgi:hypothetical protein
LTEVARCIRNFEYRTEVGRFRDWLGVVVRRQISQCLEKQRSPAAGSTGAQAAPDDWPEGSPSTPLDPEWYDAFKVAICMRWV